MKKKSYPTLLLLIMIIFTACAPRMMASEAISEDMIFEEAPAAAGAPMEPYAAEAEFADMSNKSSFADASVDAVIQLKSV